MGSHRLIALILSTLGIICNARFRSCKNVGNGSTTCVALADCPSLLNALGSDPTPDGIRKLQKLTCGFDRDEPRVCCPKNESQSTPVDHPNLSLLPQPGECGAINYPISDRIIGGRVPPHLALPWVVRIGSPGKIKGSKYFCGGTLISQRYVLTAAHCVTSDGPDDILPISVRVGEYDSTKDPDCNEESGICTFKQDFGIEKVIVHQNYTAETRFHDIALIRLKDAVQIVSNGIYPVCLPLRKDAMEQVGMKGLNGSKTSYGFVTGWGVTRWNTPRVSTILRYVHLPIIDNNSCQNTYSGVTEIASTQMCAGGLADKDSCDGDSGGPFVVASNDMQYYYQIAIVSYGPTRCGTKDLPGVYTRVSAYMQWLLDNLEQ